VVVFEKELYGHFRILFQIVDIGATFHSLDVLFNFESLIPGMALYRKEQFPRNPLSGKFVIIIFRVMSMDTEV
jgi:hypothetical protein